jgi:Leucine-rich repeat (LRR) protein
MQTLSLQHNNIAVLPQALFLLSNLTVLTVNHNPLTIFDEDFAMLQKLRRLLINHTKITRIPSTVEYMQSLREASASANPDFSSTGPFASVHCFVVSFLSKYRS